MYTMDVREITFRKRTRERLCTHISRLCVYLDIIWTGFMDIKLFMDVTDRKFNMFDSWSYLIACMISIVGWLSFKPQTVLRNSTQINHKI